MISNILFKKPVPVGALFLSDDHLESVHRILADLVYVESETKQEGSNIMPAGKDIPMKEAYLPHLNEPYSVPGEKEPKRAPKNELIESALQSVNDRLNVLHGEVIDLIRNIKGEAGEARLKSLPEEPPQQRPMNVLLDELPKDFMGICDRINSNIENVQSIRDLIL